MTNKVVIAGGTGFIGDYFREQFQLDGYEVVIISRQSPHLAWTDQAAIVEALEDAAALINLAGKSVNCRYHERNKAAIMASRTETTRLLGEAVSACANPPKLWLNSSTATIYRHAEDRPMTEMDGEIGSGFSVEVAKAWERQFFSFGMPNTRQIALRIAIVLGQSGGVVGPYRQLVKFGLGGVQGKGTQMFSWIHVKDLYRIVRFAMEHTELEGPLNCSSPNPVPNHELMRQLRRALGRGFGLPAPRWLLECGAALIRTETELVLKSRWVLPERLLQAGFTFAYPTLETALEEIFAT
ncbi:TIGR01777 family protein [Xylanibacillus composti]|uniref:NAD-dependent epimerase n=1 Tax=Xylanibacillus composti TaxID=1572762 RepID=A0A8J4H632_9BACL|nr:TIGR01777 family oxidoreductase [Xylanibacillus composti]MDT9726963.1 TIGR01777 family protein [Xylanibacillus composti]GIQ69519.1 NAD-dependent epimerase [Xylanibacillus composti]